MGIVERISKTAPRALAGKARDSGFLNPLPMCAKPFKQGLGYAAMAAAYLYDMGWSFSSWQSGEEFIVHAHKGDRKIVVSAPLAGSRDAGDGAAGEAD